MQTNKQRRALSKGREPRMQLGPWPLNQGQGGEKAVLGWFRGLHRPQVGLIRLVDEPYRACNGDCQPLPLKKSAGGS